MRSINFFIVFILSFSSCINRKEEMGYKAGSVPVEFANNVDFNDASIFDDVELIKLETRNDFLLGNIAKLVIEDSMIYILTKGHSVGLYVFNLKGGAMFKVGGLGKGPGEFITANDFYIHNDMIYIADPKQKRTNIYNIKTGAFIESRKEQFIIREFEGDGNYSYLINVNIGKKDTSLCKVLDSKYKVNAAFLNANNSSFIKGRQLYKFNNSFYLVEEVCNRILKINNGQIVHVYEFDFGKYNLTKERYHNLSRQEIRDMGIAHELAELCINDDMLTANVIVRGRFNRLYLDFKNNKALCYDLFNIKSIESAVRYYFANDSAFFGVINSDILKQFKDNMNAKDEYPFNFILPDDINVTDNPYLIVKKTK